MGLLWESHSWEIQSKNKSVCENAVTTIQWRCRLRVMGSWYSLFLVKANVDISINRGISHLVQMLRRGESGTSALIGQIDVQYILNCMTAPQRGLFRANETQRTKRQTTTVKNPNLPEANQLAIYKCSREVEPGLPGTNSTSGQSES